jgi:hypothetical protein
MKLRWKKLLAAPFVFIAAIVVLFEDWLWDDLARMAAAVGRLPIFRPVEAFIVSLSPYASLAIFAAPSLLLIPVKLIALWLIGHGQALLGLATVIAAKVVGTAMIARIYSLTEPKLLRIGWFARLHSRYAAFKVRVYSAIKSSKLYRRAHQQYLQWREGVRLWRQNRRSAWRRRWSAAIRLLRKSNQPQK